jgi:8-oxo-dGTP diphosphatase
MPGQIVVLMVTALIEKNGKYLVLRRSEKNMTNRGKWQFPEGKVRFGEDIIDAMKREVKEETDLTVSDCRMFGLHSTILKEARGAFRLFRTVFRCKVKGNLELDEEHDKHDWVNRKELDEIDFVEGFDFKDIIL